MADIRPKKITQPVRLKAAAMRKLTAGIKEVKMEPRQAVEAIKDLGDSRRRLAKSSRDLKNLETVARRANLPFAERTKVLGKVAELRDDVSGTRNFLAQGLQRIRRKGSPAIARFINAASRRLSNLAIRVEKAKGLFPKRLLGGPMIMIPKFDPADIRHKQIGSKRKMI